MAACRARCAAAIEAATVAAIAAAPGTDAEKVEVMEAFIIALIEEYDPKLVSEVLDQPDDRMIAYAINRKIREGVFELPGGEDIGWPLRPLRRAGILARLARLVAVPLWRAGFDGMPALA
jgi:hypothetical protein